MVCTSVHESTTAAMDRATCMARPVGARFLAEPSKNANGQQTRRGGENHEGKDEGRAGILQTGIAPRLIRILRADHDPGQGNDRKRKRIPGQDQLGRKGDPTVQSQKGQRRDGTSGKHPMMGIQRVPDDGAGVPGLEEIFMIGPADGSKTSSRINPAMRNTCPPRDAGARAPGAGPCQNAPAGSR